MCLIQTNVILWCYSNKLPVGYPHCNGGLIIKVHDTTSLTNKFLTRLILPLNWLGIYPGIELLIISVLVEILPDIIMNGCTPLQRP